MKQVVKTGAILIALFIINSCSLQDDRLPDQDLMLKSGKPDVTNEDIVNVKDRYIVVFNDRVTNPAAAASQFAGKSGIQVGHVYENAIRGFSASLPEQALNGLKNHPLISYIEPDLEMFAIAQTIPTGIRRISATAGIYGDNSAADVDVAIIDTGIDKEHSDLYVVGGVRYYLGLFTDSKYDDDNGHGSHVAGIVAARDNDIGVVGIVPGARLYAVKVLNRSGSGYLSDIIKGIDWVRARASTIEVINMSLGGTGTSTSYRTALANCVDAGIVVVVAAGNSGIDVFGNDKVFGTSDDYIPASYPEVAAISAMADSDGAPGGKGSATDYGPDDSFATFSNFSGLTAPGNPVNSPGNAIDLLLPGVSILSCYKDNNYATMSGTSMASPHGAGLAAKYIIENGKPSNATGVYAVRQALISAGKAQTSAEGLKVLNDPDGKLEPIGWAETGTAPINQSPVANFTFTATGLTVAFTDDSWDDVSIASWSWSFGDGGTSNLQNPSHTYASGNTYSVTLTVADGEGAQNSINQDVTVTDTPNPADIELTATTTPVKNKMRVNLSWTPADIADVYRNGTKIASGVTGTYTDMLRTKGTYTYYVQSGGTPSNTVTVTF
jgi:subtilisin family serine protease